MDMSDLDVKTSKESKEHFRVKALDDVEILAKVQNCLKAANLDDVQVALENGVMQLTGTVPDWMARRRAVVMARATVQDRLDVKEALHVDANRVAGVRITPSSERHTDTNMVKVSEKEGIVILEGEVGSQQIRELVEAVASERSGITAVLNKLEIKPHRGARF